MTSATSNIPGQLAFVAGEHASAFMPADWRMALHGASEQQEVRSRFAAFRERVRNLDRHHLLSLTGLYTLTGGIGAMQRDASYPEVAELEFLQGLMLSGDGVGGPQLPPDEVMPFWRELTTQCYVASQGEGDDASPLSGIARIQAAYYRNPYGDEFFDHMTLTITKEYDERYLRDGSLAKAGQALVVLRREIWSRYKEHDESGRVAMRGDRSEVLLLLRRRNAEMTDEAFEAAFSPLGIADLRQAAFQATEDEAVKNMFVLDPDWIKSQEAIGMPMAAVLDSLSLSHVKPIDGNQLAAANPVWSAPILKTSGTYALYSLLTLTSFPFRCLLTLLSNDLQAKSRLEKVRGWFVEQEGKRLLEMTFPSAEVVLGGFWHRTPSERVEVDLLVLTTDRLFILEAKGALIPDRVRFGAREATVQFLKAIWGKATEQGAALANHLKSATAPVTITNKKGEIVLMLDPAKTRSISRFGISVEQVGPLMNAPDLLRAAGVLNDTILAAPCVILSELAQVLRHAPDELHKLHYLLRRSQVAARYQIVGDEMDVYTTYVQYGFSELPEPDRTLMLLGASYTLDDYRDAEGLMTLPSDSALRCTPYFLSVLRHAKDRRSPAYLEIGLMLLDMPYEQQRQFEPRLKRMFNKRPRTNESAVAMAAIESLGERSALAIVHIDNRTSLEERRSVALNAAAKAREQMRADRVACIVRLWHSKDAYDAIYIVDGKRAGDEARRTT